MQDKYGTKLRKGSQLISEAVPGVIVEVVNARGKTARLRQTFGKMKEFTLSQKQLSSSSWKARKPDSALRTI